MTRSLFGSSSDEEEASGPPPHPGQPSAPAIKLAAPKQPAAPKQIKPATAKPASVPTPAAPAQAPGAAFLPLAHHPAAAVGTRAAPALPTGVRSAQVTPNWWPQVAQAWQGQARQKAQAWTASLEPLPLEPWLTDGALQGALLASIAEAPPPAAAARQRRTAGLVAAAAGAPGPDGLADEDGEAVEAGWEPGLDHSAVVARLHAWLLARPGRSATSAESCAWAAQHGITQAQLYTARRTLIRQGRLQKEELGGRRRRWEAVGPAPKGGAVMPVRAAPVAACPALPLQLDLLATLRDRLDSLQAQMQAQVQAPQPPPHAQPQQRPPLAPLPQPPQPASSSQMQKQRQQQASAPAAMPVEQKQKQHAAAAAVLGATAGKPRLGKTVRVGYRCQTEGRALFFS